MPPASSPPPASPACRLDWRPSRWVVAALLAMGPAGAVAIFCSDLSGALRLPLAACACLWALASALREHRRPPRVFIVRPDARATLDGNPLAHHHVHWRGPLAFLRARGLDGRIHRLAFWPDILDASARRALHLATATAPRGAPLAVSPRTMRG